MHMFNVKMHNSFLLFSSKTNIKPSKTSDYAFSSHEAASNTYNYVVIPQPFDCRQELSDDCHIHSSIVCVQIYSLEKV